MDEFSFPDCWKDDVRMESLFAQFKPRNVNPNNYDSKMNFWINLIESWCLHHKQPVVELSVMIRQLRRNDKSPSCLLAVFNHLATNKILISKEEFDQNLERSWTKWAVKKFIANPLKLSVNSVKNMIVRSGNSSDLLFHMPVIKKLGERVIQSVPENQKGKLLDSEDVLKMSGMRSPESLEIVLNYLSSLQLVSMYRDNSKILVKFPKREKMNVTITDFDKAIFSLEQNGKLLQKNLEKLEEKRKLFVDEARKHISEKNKLMAKMSLKRAKTVENVIKKTLEGISNIDELIYNLETAEMNGVLMDSYKVGMEGLKKFFTENNLTVENVEEVKMELGDWLSLKTDIDGVILSEKSDVTSEELEMELKNLLEEKPSEEIQLPSVPTHDPSYDNSSVEIEKKLIDLAI